MASIQNISIRNKLTVIQTIATFIAVLLCCIIFVYNDISAFKDSSKINTSSMAEIVGENCMAALVFNDKDAANKILVHFNDNPSILNAVILDKSGKEFSWYTKKGEETFSFPIPDGKSVIMEKFFEQKYIVSYQIFQENEFIGTVILRAELTDLPTIILKYVKVAIIVLLLSIVTALVISVFFQRIIIKPLLSLAKKTKEVSETNNYSIRFPIKGTDEIGVLSEGFNNMLGQIEKTSKELRQLNEQLEQRVKERTTDLTKTQAILKQSEEKYRKIVEETGDAVYSSDYKGYLTYINPICKKLTGYTESELVGKHFLEIIAPDWKQKVAKFYKEQFDNKIQETSFSFPIITKSGERKWIEQTVTQLKEGDWITGQNAIVRDITDRKKAEDELKNSEHFLNSIIENIPNMLFVKDAKDLRFVRINKAGEDLLGYSKADLMGKNDYDFFPKKDADFFSTKDKEVLESGKLLEIEEEPIHTKYKGERILETKKIPIFDSNGHPRYLLGISNDITDLKKLLAELKQKSDELTNTNKELEQFVYVASHDLQEPLRTISNFVGLLEKKYSGVTDAATVQYLQFIVDAAKRMQNLIKDLLDLSRIGRNIIYTAVDCNEVFNEVIANMEASIRECSANITSAKLPVLKGNANELKQLFQNLISNAIKFRKKNVIPEINITVEDKTTEYLFAIKDNGIGIEEQSFKKLFVIFQRLNTATEYPGTGIGLATCKKIIDLHHGKLWVESKLGEGSTFYFTLPKEILT